MLSAHRSAMKAQDAEREFRSFLAQRGKPLEALDPPGGLSAMVSFYREVRADGLRFEHDEDMLLFQWGCYEQSDGVAFDLDMTRQLIFDEPEEGSIWQLHLSFYFDPTDELRALGSGNRWCQSLDALPEFENFVTNHPAIRLVSNCTARRRRLYYDVV
jgi:hypothetical protein